VDLAKERKFLKLARESRGADDPAESMRLGEKLGQVIFGKDPSRNAPASEGGRYMKRGRRHKAAPTVSL